MRATVKQMRCYRALIGAVGMDDDVRRERLQRLYRVGSSADLTVGQMTDEIRALRRMLRGGLERAAGQAPRDRTRRFSPNDPATPEQRRLIDVMALEAPMTLQGLGDLIQNVLIEWNRWRPTNPIRSPEALTVPQARMVIEALKGLRTTRRSACHPAAEISPT